MKEGWIKIFSSNKTFEAKLAEDVLKQHGIESHIESQPDSAFPSLGSADLYTLPERAEEARRVLLANDIKL